MAEAVNHRNGFRDKKSSQTGLVYDDRLTSHYCEWNQGYTERPERLRTCYARVQELGLSDRCQYIPVRPATDKEALLCHSQKHLDLLGETRMMDTPELSKLSQSFDFVYFHNSVHENAYLALGGAIDLVEKVITGQVQNGMAMIRPPGHHAMHSEFNGYCYLNNVAVAASLALEKHGLKRVLIVDWDVHHGQGTQFQFYDDPRVLFFSIHRYEHGQEWPHLRESDYDYVGEGKGRGYNFNIPLNETGCDNSDYLTIFFNLLLPVAYEYQPELVLVSAGFDAAIGCPEGEMCVSPACFAHFVNLLKPLAGGKIALILEGGYCLRTLAEGAALSLRALLGDPVPNISPISHPKQSVIESILNVIKVHREVHPGLAFQDTLTKEEEEDDDKWQMTYPPKMKDESDVEYAELPGMSLRTQHKRPEQFPLVQECCSPVSDDECAMLERQIKQLEEETVLTIPQHRVGLLYCNTGLEMNGQSDKLCDVHTQENLLLRCQILKDTKNSSSIQPQLSVALDAITNDKIQSCVMLPRSGPFPQEIPEVLITLQKEYNIRRLLFLNLFEDHNFTFSASTGQDSSTLVLSVGCENDANIGLPNNGQFFVDIPVSRDEMKDGDLMAVCQQILLPVAYEFGPDLVILSLGGPGKQSVAGPSAACIGHVVASMQGLARGCMLLLATPGSEGGAEYVSACVSVMLGDPCRLLDRCIPQPHIVNMIKKVQDQQKSVWKTLQFREKLPRPRTNEENMDP